MENMVEFSNSYQPTSDLLWRPVSIEQGQGTAPSLPTLATPNLPASQQQNFEEKDDDDQLDEHLVEEVHKYRILWDTSARGYKDTIKKNQAWTEISLKLNKSGMYNSVNSS